MNRSKRLLVAPAALLAVALLAAGCAKNSSDSASSGGSTATVPAKSQPDANGDGQIVIGVMSPGDTNDGGYYEDFVVAARAFTAEQGWKLTIVDKVNAADAANQARNLCRQKVDMVAIAAAESKDALPVAAEEICKDTVFTLFGDLATQMSPNVAQATGQNVETQFLTGAAAGMVLKEQGKTKAGYVAGPELDFSAVAARAFTRGLQSQIPGGEVLITYTGSFDDGGKAREAVVSQTGQGAGIIYTYLGGATNAAASAAKEGGALAIAPGTDRCADPEKRFGISALFAAGGYFANILRDFKAGAVKVGTTVTYKVGVDPVPGVKVCDTVPNASTIQKAVDQLAKDIAAGKVDVGGR